MTVDINGHFWKFIKIRETIPDNNAKLCPLVWMKFELNRKLVTDTHFS